MLESDICYEYFLQKKSFNHPVNTHDLLSQSGEMVYRSQYICMVKEKSLYVYIMYLCALVFDFKSLFFIIALQYSAMSFYWHYIGQKGIGFKSVFRVTDEPEIHSNGFHIKFDVNSGPTGYILPHWVEEDRWKEGQG